MKTKINLHFLYVLSAAVLWGTAGIFVRNLENSASQMDIVFGRTFFTSLILGLTILLKDKSLFKIKLKDFWIFALSGLFSIVLFNFSYYKTMSLTTLSVAAVLLYTAPFFVLILAVLFLGSRLTLKKIICCLMAFIGCGLVSGVFETDHRISKEALFFGLLTGFGYALYTIFGEMLINRKYKTLTITFYVFLCAMIGTLPFINLSKTVVSATPHFVFWVFLMAVFNTVLPYILYTKGLFGVDATSAPIIATAEPVVATLVGTFIFKENITFFGILGILAVISAVVFLNIKPKKLKLKVNAKINLSLYISGKREDGYHEIDTVMQSISLFDKITLKKSDSLSLTCSKTHLSGEDNLGYKAAKLFFEETEISGGAEIYIEKNIPEAGGVGGGSADAGAVLLGLDRLYNTDLPREKLEEMAAKLGADVAFFIRGGTMRARGIGEVLEKLPDFNKGYFVLAKCGNKPSTGEMYRRLDSKEQPIIDIDSCVKAINNKDLSALCTHLQNSFNEVWEDKSFEQMLRSFSPLGVGLSGSGPTYFAVFPKRQDAKKCQKALISKNITAFTVRPVKKSVVFE